MFGYIRPVKGELFVKDSEFYSATYCGLCRYGGKNISHLTRWILNYDFVLLALLRMTLTDGKVCVEKKRCPYKLRKKSCVCADEVYSFVCAAFGLLTYGKLLDDIRDEKGLKRLLKITAKPIFKHIGKKSDIFEGLKEIIEKGLASTAKAEEEKCASVDRAADGFADMMRNIASYGLEGDRRLIAENCGYHIGRFIYLADAYDDFESDEKSGNYNPFLLTYGSSEQVISNAEGIKETLYDSLNAFSNHYALLAQNPISTTDRLIYNIIELGGREAVRRIDEKKQRGTKNNDKSL